MQGMAGIHSVIVKENGYSCGRSREGLKQVEERLHTISKLCNNN